MHFLQNKRGALNFSDRFRIVFLSFVAFFRPFLGCREWGCNNRGLKGCLAALPENWPKSASCPFRPFPEGLRSTWEIQIKEEKGLFPQISSDLLKPPSLKRPFAALQHLSHRIISLKRLMGQNPEGKNLLSEESNLLRRFRRYPGIL